jgi:hypothetical protein
MEVVDTGSLAVQHVWAPVDNVDTYRVGALVGWEAGAYDGVVMAKTAGAAPDANNKICGIIVAVDTYEPLKLSSAVANGSYVVGEVTMAGQQARKLGPITDKGPYVYGDNQVHVKIALLTPWTKVMVPIFNGDGAYGTAPTIQTVTTGSSTGASYTANAGDGTYVTDTSTAYCRSGANKGLMRVNGNTSATAATFGCTFSQPIAVGDTFVHVTGKFGESALTTDAEGTYFRADSVSTDSHWIFNVLELNLQNAGEEHVIGYFDYQHFD